MTKKKKALIAAGVMLAVAFIVGVTVAATGVYGTQSDPLVTKSYIDSVQTGINSSLAQSVSDASADAQARIDSKISSYTSSMQAKIDAANANAADTFVYVQLTSGQTVTVSAGSELMLRSGTAAAGPAGSLTDTTEGAAAAASQALAQNHMYLAGSDGTTVTASSDASFMIRGTYSVN